MPFLSTILEKVVLQQLNKYLDEYNIREKYQFSDKVIIRKQQY